MIDIQKDKDIMTESCIKTKRIDNWIPYVEVVPKQIRRKSGIEVAQMTEPYAGQVGLVVSSNTVVEGKLVLFDKHCKKRVTIHDQEKYFVAEEQILCEIELDESMEAVDYLTESGLIKPMDEKLYEDRRLKNYIEV